MKYIFLILNLIFVLKLGASEFIQKNYSKTIKCEKSELYIIQNEFDEEVLKIEEVLAKIAKRCSEKIDIHMSKSLICEGLNNNLNDILANEEEYNKNLKNLNNIKEKLGKFKLCKSSLRFTAKRYKNKLKGIIIDFKNQKDIISECKRVIQENKKNVCNKKEIIKKKKIINKTKKNPFKKYKKKNPFKKYTKKQKNPFKKYNIEYVN